MSELMMICPTCGKENPETSSACLSCAAPLKAQAQPALIRLNRKSQFTALFTQFEVYIDDQKVGALGNHEQGQYEVQPGAHTLYLKVDSFKSKPVALRLNAGDTIQLVCSPRILGIGVNISVEG
jgi:hypothetical protein